MSGNTTDPGDRSSAEIEREVEGTRAQLNETLGALRESASPGQLMDRAVDYLRGSGGADFTRNLGEAVRDNPLPVLLIGAGIGWLLLSGKQGRSGGAAEPQRLLPAPIGAAQVEGRRGGVVRVSPATSGDGGPSLAERASSAAGAARERAGAAVEGAQDTASDMAGRAGEAVGGAYRAAADTAGSVAEDVGATARAAARRAGELGQEAREQAGRLGDSAQQGWGWLLREQPLVLGAIGVALGAAVGAVLPGTRAEDRLMGETSDAVAEKATAAAQQVSGRAQEAAGEHLERAKSAVGETYGKATGRLDQAGLSADKIGEALGQAARDVRQGVSQAVRDTAAEAHRAVESGGAASPGGAGRAEGAGQASDASAGAAAPRGRPPNPA
jgi:uncharacterized protein YjbJ (UPF0337 family)